MTGPHRPAGRARPTSLDTVALNTTVGSGASRPAAAPSKLRHRATTRGSVRVRRSALIFQALLVVAMIVALATTWLGSGSTGSGPDATSPDAPPPAVFIFPSD